MDILRSYMSNEAYESLQFHMVLTLLLDDEISYLKKSKTIHKLKKYIDITAYNHYDNRYYGLTIVHILAMFNLDQEINMLSFSGASLDLPALESGKTPLDIAIEYYNLDAIISLVRSGKVNLDNHYIIKSVKQNLGILIIRLLVAFGGDVNQKDSDGKNALYYAYILDQQHDIDYLLSNGAIYDEKKYYYLVRKYRKSVIKLKRFFSLMP
jgi:ankyrin repeat protein